MRPPARSTQTERSRTPSATWPISGTAGAEVTGETVRLWGVGTLPRHMGRGVYRALVMERCRHARALSATLALAKANAVSASPILPAAGFRPVATP